MPPLMTGIYSPQVEGYEPTYILRAVIVRDGLMVTANDEWLLELHP